MRIFIMILMGFSLLWGEHYWDNFRGNYRQDGLSPLKGPTKPVFLGRIEIEPPSLNKSSEKNIYSEKIGYAWPSSAGVISEDSTLYAHTTKSSNHLIAVKNAQLLWREEFSGENDREMCMDEKGLLYFGTGYCLTCFDPKERIILWESAIGGVYISIIYINGGSNIYVMSGSSYSDDFLYAINKDNGGCVWSYNLGEENSGIMAIGTDNGYYYAHWYDKLTVFYPPNGFRYGCSPEPTPPSIDKNGVIYSVASDTLYAYNPGLYLKWKTALNDTIEFQSPCALSPDGGIIACSPRGYVHKVSRDGKKLWTSEFLCHDLRIPTVDSDGRIYIYGYNGIPEQSGLYCLNNDGAICFSIHDVVGSGSTQVLIAPGRIIYVFDDVRINCFGQDPNGFEDREDRTTKIPEKEIKVYPNPFKDRLNIETPSSGAVYDITGRKVYSFSKGVNKADTNSWKEGIYIVKAGKECKRVVKVR